MNDIDVIVVGGGAAGLTAALSAQEAGANVRLLEGAAELGGATRMSAGMVMAAGTDVQRGLGLEDDAGDFYQEYLLYYQYWPLPALASRIAFEGAPGISWLQNLGVVFHEVMPGGAERVPRGHVPPGGAARKGGQYLIDVLAERCHERGIEITLVQRVDRLLYEGGAVRGVAVGDQEITAGAVVLATGGFGANPELVREYLPAVVSAAGDRSIFYTGPETSRGDGLTLARQLGARIVGIDQGLASLRPDTGGKHNLDPYTPPWMILVGPDGRRLVNEATVPYGGTKGKIRDAGGRAFAIFDARLRAENGSPELPTFKARFDGAPARAYIWHPEGIDEMVDAGGIVEAQTLEGLAETLGLPVRTLVTSIARYNQFAADGEDRDFLKDPALLRPIEQPPFYGAELRPDALQITNCGAEIDESGRVIGEDMHEIDGLFAAGECSGGAIGLGYIGGGNSLANCVVFGRVAGRSAATSANS
jgi:fumarate reductase flavoprotein subunit